MESAPTRNIANSLALNTCGSWRAYSVEPGWAISWYLNGALHRSGGPALEWADGAKEWWKNGQRHREDGPAIVYSEDSSAWYLNGQLHRVGGPAVVTTGGAKAWYLHGQLHCEDGPAVVGSDGTNDWYLHGVQHTEEEFRAAQKPSVSVVNKMLSLRKKFNPEVSRPTRSV